MAISLSSGVRQSLQSLQSTAAAAQVAQSRLASGKKVNSAIDSPVNFFTASSLNNRAEAFSGLLDGISNSIQTIKAASSGIDGITKLVKSAQAVIKQARSSTDADTRTALGAQYTELKSQIDSLAKDSGFNGTNLLSTDQLVTTFNEKTGTDKNKLTINGGISSGGATPTYSAVSSSSLGLTTVGTGFTATDAAANTSLDSESDNLSKSLTTLTSLSSTLGANLAIVQARQDFSKSLIDTLKTGADNLVNADTNEEGANLLALQTRQSLSQTALSLSAQADQAVLKLF